MINIIMFVKLFYRFREKDTETQKLPNDYNLKYNGAVRSNRPKIR